MDNGPKEEAWEEMTRIQEYDKELRSRVNRLRRYYIDFYFNHFLPTAKF